MLAQGRGSSNPRTWHINSAAVELERGASHSRSSLSPLWEPVLNQTHRRNSGQIRKPHLVNGLNHPRGTQKRVLAQQHRRGARMRFLAAHRHLIPAHALHAGDNADHFFFRFKYRPLLYVKLKHRLELMGANGLGTEIADALQLITKLDAVAVLACVRKLRGEDACINSRAQHGRRKARTFLIRPVHDHQGRIAFIAHVNQRAQRF